MCNPSNSQVGMCKNNCGEERMTYYLLYQYWFHYTKTKTVSNNESEVRNFTVNVAWMWQKNITLINHLRSSLCSETVTEVSLPLSQNEDIKQHKDITLSRGGLGKNLTWTPRYSRRWHKGLSMTDPLDGALNAGEHLAVTAKANHWVLLMHCFYFGFISFLSCTVVFSTASNICFTQTDVLLDTENKESHVKNLKLHTFHNKDFFLINYWLLKNTWSSRSLVRAL